MNIYKRRDEKKHVVASCISKIAPLYNSQVKAPHCLMELSQRDYNRIKNNCIHVCGLSLIKDTSTNTSNGAIMAHYNVVSYGCNVDIDEKNIDTSNVNQIYQYINLCKSKGNYIAMVGDKDECKSMIPNTYTFSSCLHKFTSKNKPIKMSGKLVLLMATVPKINTKMCSDKV